MIMSSNSAKVIAVCCVLLASRVAVGEVTHLTDASFPLSKENPWLVEFAKSDKRMSELKQIDTALQGTGIKVGFVDSTKEKKAASGNIGLRLFGPSKRARNIAPSTGSLDPATVVDKVLKEIQVEVSNRLPKTQKPKQDKKQQDQKKQKKKKQAGVPIELNDGNFDELVGSSDDAFIIAFVAPWCGHCQRLMPEWDQAAAQLNTGTGVNVAKVDATENQRLAQRFQVQGYPTIKFFPPGKENKGDRDAVDYQMERNAQSIVSWSLSEFERLGGKVEIDIPEITSQDIFDEVCDGKCIIAFLPHLMDSGKAGREEYIETLKEAQRNARHMSFGWIEGGGAQEKWETTYSLGFGFPAVLYLRTHQDKKLGLVMKGHAFTGVSLGTFASTGKKLSDFSELGWPDIQTTTPWDGEDAEVIEEEDDFDLDEFLNED